MRLYEHEAKKAFQMMGIALPEQYGIIRHPEELGKMKLTFPVMLKSMVLVGGRGKAGGIRKANNIEEARKAAGELLRLRIKGYPVDMVLVEAAREYTGACYVGVTMDPDTYNNILIVSASGGVDIEEVARTKPEAIKKIFLSNNEMQLPNQIKKEAGDFLAKGLGGGEALAKSLADVVGKVYAAYQEFDAKICEINPLLITNQGPVAVDAKIVLDDNALFRQTKLLEAFGIESKRHDVAEPTANETRAYKAGFAYVDLIPENYEKDKNKLYVALAPGGAGYGIFSIDEVANIGERFFGGRVVPINFMDSGGGPKQETVAEMFHLLMDNPVVDVVITSRFGGISSCDVFIRGLVQTFRERHGSGRRIVPVYGRMVGTDLPSARAYLEKVKVEFPEALKDLHMIVGNQKIMADVIKDAIADMFRARGWQA